MVASNGTVQGSTPAGSTLVGNPLPLAAVDNLGKVRALQVNDGGGLQVNTPAPLLSTYAFTSTSGTATLSGYYVDYLGAQVGAGFSYSISSATTLTTLAGGTLPDGAVGVYFSLTGAPVYVGRGGLPNGTITGGQNPASGYPQIQITSYGTLGRFTPSWV